MIDIMYVTTHITNFPYNNGSNIQLSTSLVFLFKYHPAITMDIHYKFLNNAYAFAHNLFLDFHLFLNLNEWKHDRDPCKEKYKVAINQTLKY
jgi:hypothetical protein